MEYFNLTYDARIKNPIVPIGLSKVLNKSVLEDMNMIESFCGKLQQFNIDEKQGNLYVDYIDNPIPVVSDRLKDFLGRFEPSILFIPLVFVDEKNNRYETYWGIVPKSIDCISDKAEFNKDDSMKRLVIDKKKLVDGPRVFKVANITQSVVVIDLCTAEGILRRNFLGIELYRAEKEN